MSKMGKNLLIGFTILCVAVFVVFCIELIILNSEKDNSRGEAVSGDSLQETGDPPDATQTSDTADPSGESQPPGSGQPDGDGRQDETRPIPKGRSHTLPMPLSKELVLYADEADFIFSDDLGTEERLAMFTYSDGGESSLEIRFGSVTLEGPDALANDIIGDYPGGVQITRTGDGPILRSSLNAVSYLGKDDDVTYEICIHNVIESDTDSLAVVFIIHYRDNSQRDAIYAILETMEMRSLVYVT